MTKMAATQVTPPKTRRPPGAVAGTPSGGAGAQVLQLRCLAFCIPSETQLLADISALEILTAQLSTPGRPCSYIKGVH